MKTARLHVELREVEPAVTRVIDVTATATLPELHELLQAALGWTDSHLHQFVTPKATYGMAIPGEDIGPDDEQDETNALLADLGDEFDYLYDFGDGWTHHVQVLGRGSPTPGCIDGHGACPPEDCGGPHGYTELLGTLADPNHPEHDHMRRWVGNRLHPFDRAATDLRVRRVVGEVPQSVRLLLDLLADGVKLTPGGRLPRTVVREMHEHRPHWYPLGPASIEDDLPPLGALHDVLRDVRLLRLRHGVLTPTRAAGDDLDVVRRLRSAYEPKTFATEITERAIGILAAHGPLPLDELAPRVLEVIGYGWQRDGQPITAQDVRTALAQESRRMEGLDLIDNADWRVWTLGPSALSLLPGATMLAEIYATDRR